MITAADIWPIIKLRLSLQDDSLQTLVTSYIEEIEMRILHYCGIKAVPVGLKFTWASMAIDAVRIDLPNVAEISDTVGGAESIKVGDTQVSPARGGGDVSNTSKSAIDKVVLNYRIDLNRYRKLRW
ncbi:DNA-packaging protein [Desulfitobacterium hafniense]|uniref:DNA-packaging protein n=1 Tax=Desulfitobacterium hafniense TaxID=49338 RepID=UPI000361E666|nr:DNA-packaging protein [Desulfitobacterium hafniense]